jgi:hypothetical protein
LIELKTELTAELNNSNPLVSALSSQMAMIQFTPKGHIVDANEKLYGLKTG